MDLRRASYRAGSETSGSSLTSSKEASHEDVNQFFIQVKKALAFCRRCTRMSWSKSRADNFESIGLQSMSSTSSNGSRACKPKLRPIMLRLGRSDETTAHSHRLSPSFTYTASSASDPFITSPSWLKDEFSTIETRT